MSKFDLLMKKHPSIKQTLSESNEKRIKSKLKHFDNTIKFQEDKNNFKRLNLNDVNKSVIIDIENDIFD